jgi:hypothetical protein
MEKNTVMGWRLLPIIVESSLCHASLPDFNLEPTRTTNIVAVPVKSKLRDDWDDGDGSHSSQDLPQKVEHCSAYVTRDIIAQICQILPF